MQIKAILKYCFVTHHLNTKDQINVDGVVVRQVYLCTADGILNLSVLWKTVLLNMSAVINGFIYLKKYLFNNFHFYYMF